MATARHDFRGAATWWGLRNLLSPCVRGGRRHNEREGQLLIALTSAADDERATHTFIHYENYQLSVCPLAARVNALIQTWPQRDEQTTMDVRPGMK